MSPSEHARTDPAADWRVWLLIVALLPSLTFLGHWNLRFDIPRTHSFVSFPLPARANGDGVGEHGSHCHANAASCSDAPFTGVSAFALLSDWAAHLAPAGAMRRLSDLYWEPHRAQTVAPRLRPPEVTAVRL